MIFAKYSKQLASLTRRWLGLVLMTGAMAVAGPVQAELPATQHYGNVEYLTGGFGIDESTAIKNVMPDYPLAFTFSARGGDRAAYVSQVQVVVRDQHDATVLNVESQGPFLLVRLAPGVYRVHATYRNQTQSRTVTLSDAVPARMVFEWIRDDTAPVDRAPASTSEPQPEFAPGSIPGLD